MAVLKGGQESEDFPSERLQQAGSVYFGVESRKELRLQRLCFVAAPSTAATIISRRRRRRS